MLFKKVPVRLEFIWSCSFFCQITSATSQQSNITKNGVMHNILICTFTPHRLNKKFFLQICVSVKSVTALAGPLSLS